MFKKKPVKVILCNPPKSMGDENCFEVKKVINTMKVRVGEYIDSNMVSDWIKNKDNWTIEFVQ